MKLNKKEIEEWIAHLEIMEKFHEIERHGIKMAEKAKEKVDSFIHKVMDNKEKDQ